MRKVFGIGETIFDIIFDQNNTPQSGKPGGSVFNALISLGRSGVNCSFISEVGNDRLGKLIREFLTANNVDNSSLCSFDNGKTPLALAFLDNNSNAQYDFYKDYPAQRLQFAMPKINADDIILIGSYFALNPILRKQVKEFLDYSRKANALIYYDVNFRSTHTHEADTLMPTIKENFQYADIVKGSDEDFYNMFGTNDWRSAYHLHIKPYCPIFICTQGAKGATLLIEDNEYHIDGKNITPISTVGAGDSFNAGTIYGIIQNEISRSTLYSDAHTLIKALQHGIEFSAEVCQSYDNYIKR